ncbi:MAG: TorF family putative porin [Novosphingobium sp.]
MPAAALARDDGNSKSAFSITANATLASDYRFRGISLSDKDPAIQGGFDINHDSGLFAGTWASSIATNGGADMELDLYGGYGGSAAGIDYSMTALVYVYPGTSGLNYFEVLTSLSTSAGPATFGVDAGWVPSQNNFGGDNLYLAGKAEMPLGDTNATLFGHLGYENGDVYDNKLDWEAGISYAAGPLTASLSYVDTNYSGAKEAGRLARAGVVASITANF